MALEPSESTDPTEPSDPIETTQQRTDTPLLQTENLVKRFGQFTATDRVDLTIERGEFRSVIGPNGAGKTTLFNLITGALPVTAGAIYFDGVDITTLSPSARVRRGVGRSFQISNVFGGLTVRENVRLAIQSVARDEYTAVESLFKPTDRYDELNDRTEAILERIGLAHVAAEQANALAYGDKRRLEIGVVLATDPELVLFDEPTAGMSVEETQETIDLLEAVLVDQTLLLIEHDIELVMELSDRITVLNGGQILAEGTPAEIAANQDVQNAYLGGMTE
ncbi:ABC transporter ATP-binding protein [Natrialba taiwanensis]|uniref:Probable branched-chain amino acid transport ATP-binding protein LivG n=1 Tax=Natrialba taiwanensis DSM 12281 TaxID=1230458 RepID=M0AFF4_9EURY|nr:ABC transporter ATP-binding protein [Natrialba taiwanensis]ELY96058.1 ABC transporter [Natrialba taiwanensis DSM 12281]